MELSLLAFIQLFFFSPSLSLWVSFLVLFAAAAAAISILLYSLSLFLSAVYKSENGSPREPSSHT